MPVLPVVHRLTGFGPTVLLGLTGAALAAVSAARDWATATGSAAGVDVTTSVKGSASAPLAVALALVALAAWGVVLVLRGRARQVGAAVGALASAGVLATALSAFGRAQDDAVQAAVARGATGDVVASSLTAWYYLSVGAAAVTLLTFTVAVVAAPRWPAMGSRYDAPGGTETVPEQDMWRALDDGRDPTA